jgi:hypothetical protein
MDLDALRIELDALWRESPGGAPPCIAVVDGAVDLGHPCFEGADLTSDEALGLDSAPSDHGTQVASILFGQRGSAVEGLAPRCRGLSVTALSLDPSGEGLSGSTLDLARAIERAIERGADVINVSGGVRGSASDADPYLRRALLEAESRGVLVVAAVGNEGAPAANLPAAFSTVLAVGAMGADGLPLSFSSWGEDYRSHGVLAPGEASRTAVLGGSVRAATGTSVAAATASAVGALLIAFARERAPRERAASLVRGAIVEGAEGCDVSPAPDCHRLLAGRLSAARALRTLQKGLIQPMSEAMHTSEAEGASQSHLRVTPSACGEAAKAPQKAYALGRVGYDFGTEARRDSFAQMGLENPLDQRAMLEHLKASPAHAAYLHWTLRQDSTAVYAIVPAGPFAAEAYARLREFLEQQLSSGVEQVSIPGVVTSGVRLSNGQQVPMLIPDLRGMYSWSTTSLVASVLGDAPVDPVALEAHERRAEEICNFLDRVYYELRNLGTSPQDRAMNFAATNAFQVERVFASAIEKELRLESITSQRSPVSRPDSDCWDIKLTFFHPTRRTEVAPVVYRFTVDVSDVVPVTIGKVRRWELG